MKFHRDEKEDFKRRIEKNKDDIARMNREIQKKREEKKKKNQ